MNTDFAIYSYGDKIAEVKDDKVYISRDMLKNQMYLYGVPIPGPLQESFNNKRRVTFDDPLFTRAFIQIYCPDYLQRQGCKFEMADKTNSFVDAMKLLKLGGQ
jgi:hypothetical protein